MRKARPGRFGRRKAPDRGSAPPKRRKGALDIKIRTLDLLSDEDLFWVDDGYVSEERYRVTKTEGPERTVISLDLERLATPYLKRWDAPSSGP